MSITVFLVIVCLILGALYVAFAAPQSRRAATYELLRLSFAAAAIGLAIFLALRGHSPL